MYQNTPRTAFSSLLQTNKPQAIAKVQGNNQYPQLSGLVKFYTAPYGGIIIESEIFGLPDITTPMSSDFYAMHIHEYGDCSNAFQNTGNHYNPSNQLHPFHAGDLLPLLSNQGYAWSAFVDMRFSLNEVIGRSVIIHSQRDDFVTQPSGDSGSKIACGVIMAAT